MKLLLFLSVLLPMSAFADWHHGTVRTLGFGYEGQDLVLEVTGVNKTSCGCYPTWPNMLCISRTRTDFKEVYAFLLKARATREPINVNIDESSCLVLALYEAD